MDIVQFSDVTSNGITFFRKAQLIDFKSVISSLIQQEFTGERIKTALSKYLFFLTLTYIHPTLVLVPTQDIDAVHHAFMSDSIQYQQEMNRLKHWVKHIPYIEGYDIDRESLMQRFLDTKRLFRAMFGVDMIEVGENDNQIGGCYLQKVQHNELPVDVVRF